MSKLCNFAKIKIIMTLEMLEVNNKAAPPLPLEPQIYYKESANPQSFQKLYFLESYGCAMNFSDSEIVASILEKEGYVATKDFTKANLIFLNTCSIREKAEQTIRQRLSDFKSIKKKNSSLAIGILGCMAERLKNQLLVEEKLVDIVVGPDAYRTIPQLLHDVDQGQKAVNVLLSREETYHDITPIRIESDGILAFISIMRGCNNMCSFCVVPFTRGRERSRDSFSIINEARDLFSKGYREITLLGQNVDSYFWIDENTGEQFNFAKLLAACAQISPLLRIRFSTSHPKDITIDVLETIKLYSNLCRYIHLPIQSGNNRILQLMNRQYSSEWYLNKVKEIKTILPDCSISTDIISGFCSETVDEHQDTLRLMESVKYDLSYMFMYSERPGTLAARRFIDDVPILEKKKRLEEIISLQNKHSLERYQQDIGKIFEVLIEGDSKKSSDHFKGRTSQNKMTIFPKQAHLKYGDYVQVKILSCTQGTLFGIIKD
ncbi:MAG: tRNA (N6-isopentenyl adenosine(37)-C2)-methylthiotransferase MiaB [Alphaproteobacteria bacterium]|nr:tRNA (N6-isopentenyl adenosine(37)-C2)-methylthiotransferase MiaB [Alphaproteobacteria bacterium]